MPRGPSQGERSRFGPELQEEGPHEQMSHSYCINYPIRLQQIPRQRGAAARGTLGTNALPTCGLCRTNG